MEQRGRGTGAEQGGGFAPLSHGTIVGAKELLVMEFINSDHDWEEVFTSAGGCPNIVQFRLFHSLKK